MIKKLVLLTLFVAVSQPALAGKKITILGQEFSFTISEPEGWHCECEGTEAASIGANLAMWPKGETLQTAQPLIYGRVNTRGKSAADDMQADLKEAKSKNKKIKFSDFKLETKNGEVSSKIFKIGKDATEYVVYLYPEKSKKNALSITMHVDKREATEKEINAFKEVVSSVGWMADGVDSLKK